MRRPPLVAWVVLVVWASWLFALQGLVASAGHGFAPDAGLLLLLALGERLPPARLRWAALWIALARIGLSAAPPLPILAGYLGVAGLVNALRGVAELRGPLSRAVLAGGCALALALLWSAARGVRLGGEVGAGLVATVAWPGALATAVLALALLPVFARLPGLSALARGAAGDRAAALARRPA